MSTDEKIREMAQRWEQRGAGLLSQLPTPPVKCGICGAQTTEDRNGRRTMQHDLDKHLAAVGQLPTRDELPDVPDAEDRSGDWYK